MREARAVRSRPVRSVLGFGSRKRAASAHGLAVRFGAAFQSILARGSAATKTVVARAERSCREKPFAWRRFSRRMSVLRRSAIDGANALEVFFCINAGGKRAIKHEHGDLFAVVEGAQLLEALDLFNGCLLKRREAL